jgi:hypothetical protein
MTTSRLDRQPATVVGDQTEALVTRRGTAAWPRAHWTRRVSKFAPTMDGGFQRGPEQWHGGLDQHYGHPNYPRVGRRPRQRFAQAAPPARDPSTPSLLRAVRQRSTTSRTLTSRPWAYFTAWLDHTRPSCSSVGRPAASRIRSSRRWVGDAAGAPCGEVKARRIGCRGAKECSYRAKDHGRDRRRTGECAAASSALVTRPCGRPRQVRREDSAEGGRHSHGPP